MGDLGFDYTWYGHACVQIGTPGGRTILIDPWFGNPRSTQAGGCRRAVRSARW